MTTVRITLARLYRQFGSTGKALYYLPAVSLEANDGRVVTYEPGGYGNKAEALRAVRRLYSARPLTVEWPDGKTTEVK